MRTEQLWRIVNARLVDHAAPLMVEGIAVLGTLAAIERRPDFLVYLDGEGSHALSERLAAHRRRHQPEQRAELHMPGFAE